ncbi:helix-turn-helix domain-containing protein [Sedimenticola sp.]|uniref:helix-turn-helix domain-containing protein n=1 Tax=Sedimenticola sp. TaxID=1940285 RepID=UPI003D12131E
MPDMTARLSVRSYNLTMCAHAHGHAQLVFPLHGAIEIAVDHSRGRVGPGQCVVIPAGHQHSFRADERSRFLVVDLPQLPASMQRLPLPFASVAAPLQAFCLFAEKQLQHQLNRTIEQRMGELFDELLREQDFMPRVDPRIARVLEQLEVDLSETPSLTTLASLACLSLSQYKALFKKQTGKTTGQYLLALRMERARALLANSDCPISRVAEQVGYQDASAFSRRFARYYGQPPSHYGSSSP